MDIIEIKRPVLVKVIITENFKKQMIAESKEAVAGIEKSLADLNTLPSTVEKDQQISELTRLKENFLQKIKDFEAVQLGAELAFKNIEGIAQLKTGDDLLQKITAAEIIIKDWIIQEIRNN